MADLDSAVPRDAIVSTGAPRHSRRLTDKVLAAFNHAYSVGEVEVARRLREILAEIDDDEIAVPPTDRRGADALGQADLWMGFVEARNRYRRACDTAPRNVREVAEALVEMQAAYRAWSLS